MSNGPVVLPALNTGYKNCPKCGMGATNAQTIYTPADPTNNVTEFMERICSRCGFQWKEAPLG